MKRSCHSRGGSCTVCGRACAQTLSVGTVPAAQALVRVSVAIDSAANAFSLITLLLDLATGRQLRVLAPVALARALAADADGERREHHHEHPDHPQPCRHFFAATDQPMPTSVATAPMPACMVDSST